MSPLDAPLNREQPTNFSLVPQHPLTLQPYSLQSTAAATQWPYPYPTSPTRIPALPALALATDKIVLGYSGYSLPISAKLDSQGLPAWLTVYNAPMHTGPHE